MNRSRPATVRRAALVWTLLVVPIAVVTLTATPAGACSCAGVTDQEAYRKSDAVFTGTLVDTVVSSGGTWSSADPERFVFEVDRALKGEVSARQTIVTPRSGASCGLEISGPGPFVVYATKQSTMTTGAEEGELFSHLCSGTRALADPPLPAELAAAVPWLRSAGAGALGVLADSLVLASRP